MGRDAGGRAAGAKWRGDELKKEADDDVVGSCLYSWDLWHATIEGSRKIVTGAIMSSSVYSK